MPPSANLSINNPILEFKAGRCDVDGSKVTPVATPGYLYLYTEDEDLIHFCWRPRTQPSTDPEIDLITVPGDATFRPVQKDTPSNAPSTSISSPTNGRIFRLKFGSSGEKYYFWLQGGVQHSRDHAHWSARDTRVGELVDMVLSEDVVNVQMELDDLKRENGSRRGGGDDGEDLMELDRTESGTGGAGAGATGGDAREEGESSREGGADGGRA